ncbi:MAG: hypothetical protein P4L35_05770 [Ignavibacteriaceae bacterium]|nr:hypothetical protein [Ignavibacteriaceae bacterium]
MNKITHRFYIGSFFAIGIAATVYLLFNGYQYYSSPLEDRFFLSQHLSLKPSGTLGHGIGILGSLMMIIGVAIYIVRKRIRRFSNLGILKHWLEFHIFLCSLGPVFVLYHTAFKFGGIVAVSFWSMVAVVLSGVVGRFIYIQIPHSISGQELNMNDLNSMTSELDNKLRNETSLSSGIFREIESAFDPALYSRISLAAGIIHIVTEHFKMHSFSRKLKSDLKSAGLDKLHIKETLKTVKSKIIISRRIGLLRKMHNIFRYWHVFHLPFAIVMFVIMFIHVAVTIVFGYKWIF